MSVDLSLKIPNLKDSLNSLFPGLTLGNPSVGFNAFDATAAAEAETVARDIKFSFQVSGNVGVRVFNSSEDGKVDGKGDPVLGLPDQPPPKEDELDLRTPLRIDYANNAAVVKTVLTGKVGGNISGGLGGLKFGIEGSKTIELARYTRHRRDEDAALALFTELATFEYALRQDSILQLQADQALSYRVTGALSANLSFSWSELLMENLNLFTGLLQGGEAFAIKVAAGLKAEFKASISDDFISIFTREQNNQIRLNVKKARTRGLAVSGSFGIGVEFADPEAAAKQLEVLLKAAAGPAFELLNKILGDPALAFGNLNATEQALVNAAANRLGLNSPGGSLDALRAEWKRIRELFSSTVTKVVESKIQFAIEASYKRIEEGTTILEAVLSHQAIQEQHRNLLLCHLDPILEQIKAEAPGYQLIRYFSLTKLTSVRKLGPMLAIGPLKLGGQDSIEKTKVTVKNIDSQKRISYSLARGYKGVWFGGSESWIATIKAEMDAFRDAPTIQDFKFGLSFKYTQEESQLSRDELRKLLDHAIIWRAINTDDIDDILNEHQLHIDNRLKAILTVELQFDHEIFPAMLAGLPEITDEHRARFLAAATPPVQMVGDGRMNVELRTALYSPLWRVYLNDPIRTPREYQMDAVRRLRNSGSGRDAANFEQLSSSGGSFSVFSYGGLIEKNGSTGGGDHSGILQKLNGFQTGLSRLHQSLQNGNGNESEIPKFFDKMQPFWSVNLLLRTSGVMLLHLAQRDAEILKKVTRTLKITYPTLQGENEFLYSVSIHG